MNYNKSKFNQCLSLYQKEQAPRVENTFSDNWITPIVKIKGVKAGEIFTPIYSSYMIPVIPNGRYFISTFGRVYDSYIEDYLPLYDNGYGYYIVLKIPFTKEWKHFYIHQLMMFYFNYIPEYKDCIVRHYDENCYNNNLYNLGWADKSSVKLKGGISDSRYKYTEDDIRKVCKLLEDRVRPCKIEEITGMTKSVIHKIKHHISWNNISKDYNF